MPIQLPPPLPDRPVVRVVHPCGTLAPHRAALEAGLERLERAGCRIRWKPERADACWRGYLAGRDAERCRELVDALAEPGVDAVWFARGGSGGGRIAAAVVDAARSFAPRALVGFSDATVFLNLFASRLGWVTFHGPVVTSLAHPAIDTDIEALLAVLRGERRAVRFAPAARGPGGIGAPTDETAPSDARADRPGPAGVLMGGNLTVLAASVGTPAAPAAVPDGLWLLEDVGEPPYRLDRSFTQVRSAGVLDGARALWIGDLGLPDEADPAIVDRFGEDSGLPVFTGAPAGHRGLLDILPIGGCGQLDVASRTFRATAPWVGHRP